MAKHITVSGLEFKVFPKDGKVFTLEEMQEYVGYQDEKIVQIVPMPSGLCMVVNENGKLIGLKKNEKATEIWKKEYPKDVYDFNNDELIVGNVLICSAVESGEECDHTFDEGICTRCGDDDPGPDDFTGATPGDR